ncbi:Preprotein translocase subunit SecG (TC 3.A.5.1.1) [hydrothermal vent metagenome]|uniref:Preprotein translocase subunit SecG (TC 3.A.5.1.1) n=1 Tax=hydrothermal vent metagenome TaxID=652676 RepID=A0A3B1E7B3_9ZZZZ
MTSTLLIIQFILAILITIIILLQKSSSMGLGAYSGSNDSMFGAKGPANFLTKLTFILGVTFVINTIALGWFYNQNKEHSVIDNTQLNSIIPKTIESKDINVVAPAAPITIQEADSDSDGIYDKDDKCPNTILSAKVDKYGCQIFEEPVNLDITFENNSNTITKDDSSKFKAYANYLHHNKSAKIIIEAHTDNTGEKALNLELSKKRANSAKNILIKLGVDSNRIQTIGYGEAKPLVSNDSQENRKLNRRVTARIIK